MKNIIKFYSVKDIRLLGLFIKFYFGKYLFHRKEFPLYSILGKDSILNNIKMRYKVKLKKLVKHQGKYYSCISVPAYPSSAMDNMVAKGGFNFNSAGTEKRHFIDLALLAVTSKCPNNCLHCYEKTNINNGTEVPVSKWIKTIKELQDYGTGIIVLTGGEPLADFYKTITILKSINKNLSEIHLHTSGKGITKEKAELLKMNGLSVVFVGLDDYRKEKNDEMRGSGSFDNALKAIKIFNEANILTCTNICLTKELVNSNRLWNYLLFINEHNVAITHLIEPKVCGGFNGSNGVLFTDLEKKIVEEFLSEANTKWKYRNYPLVYSTNFMEKKENYGCRMGGLSHLYIDSRGNVNPCVFLPVIFGNIKEKTFMDIYKEVRTAIPKPLDKCAADYIPLHISEKKDYYDYKDVKDIWEEMYK